MLEAGELSEGHGRALLLCKDHAGPASARALSGGPGLVGARDRAAREGVGPAGAAEKAPIVLHPDLADAIGAAEDALTAALGREVRVKKTSVRLPRGVRVRRARARAIELAERVLSDLAA